MSRPIVLGVAALLLFAFGVIAANTRIVQGVIPVTAYEADVNKDTRVNVADLGLVASKYGQIAPTATPTATRPQIVGNRGFVASSGEPHRLINTDDGSTVTTLAIGFYPVDTSCDGAYAALAKSGALRIIDKRDGSTIVDVFGDNTYAPYFTCPLWGLGAAFSSGTPVANRAVVQATVVQGSVWRVSIYDLETGQTLYESGSVGSGLTRSCDQRTVAIQNLPGDSLTIVRLSDGSVAATIPGNALSWPC